MAFIVAGPASAVHDIGLFELDGDAINGSAPGSDWNSLANTIARAFIVDGHDPSDTTYFHQGGSKDIHDITDWRRTTNDEAPDKDEILDAFAAAYNHGGDLVVYFGADRFSNDGDSQIGFWFLQDEVTLSNGTFNGAHVAGDLLVLSDFTNGGDISTIKVFAWVGSGGSHGSLNLLGSGLDCTDASADDACATVNDADTGAPWAYTPKQGTPGTFPAGAFFEGGMNVSNLLSKPPCFATFLAETRTSQSEDARLKDFTIGSFETCPSKSGVKFEDINANGRRDSGEPGLAGWEIHLFGEGEHRHATTGSNGSYSFTGLPPGTYTVCETLKPGWLQSVPESGPDCNGHSGASGRGFLVTLGFGEHETGNDFGNFRPASKSGTKFHDLDADGVKDLGEPGLAGWEIHMFGSTAVGAFDLHTTTDATGAYKFEGLRPGTYTVCETVVAGWTQSSPSSGVDCSGHGGGFGYQVTLASGQNETGNDFGNFLGGETSGLKFSDLDGDGIQDPGEPGLAGWEIHLFGLDSTGQFVHLHTTTDSSGNYRFPALRPGTYTICETIPANWKQTFPAGGADCSAHGGGFGHVVTLASGQSIVGNTLGNVVTPAVLGEKIKSPQALPEALPRQLPRTGGTYPALAIWGLALLGAGWTLASRRSIRLSADGPTSLEMPITAPANVRPISGPAKRAWPRWLRGPPQRAGP
jgi:hypothetical protein